MRKTIWWGTQLSLNAQCWTPEVIPAHAFWRWAPWGHWDRMSPNQLGLWVHFDAYKWRNRQRGWNTIGCFWRLSKVGHLFPMPCKEMDWAGPFWATRCYTILNVHESVPSLFCFDPLVVKCQILISFLSGFAQKERGLLQNYHQNCWSLSKSWFFWTVVSFLSFWTKPS